MVESNIADKALEKVIEVGGLVLVAIVVVAAAQTVLGGSFIDLVALI